MPELDDKAAPTRIRVIPDGDFDAVDGRPGNIKGVKAKRIVSFQELSHHRKIKIDEAGIKRVRDNLDKLPANKRPKKRKSLTAYILSLLTGMEQKEIDNVIEDLFIKKIVYEENGIIKYDLDLELDDLVD